MDLHEKYLMQKNTGYLGAIIQADKNLLYC